MSHAGRFVAGLIDTEDGRCRRLLEEVTADTVDVRVLEEWGGMDLKSEEKVVAESKACKLTSRVPPPGAHLTQN